MEKCKLVMFLVFKLLAVIGFALGGLLALFYGMNELLKWLGYDCDIKTISEILGIAIAIGTLWKGLQEFREYRKRQRIQYLIDFGKRYTENEDIVKVVEFLEELEDNNTKGQAPAIHKVEMYMRFFEELQLLIEKKAIDPEEAHYLFGHYTPILKEHWELYWPTLGYNEKYWEAFRAFEREEENINDKNKEQ